MSGTNWHRTPERHLDISDKDHETSGTLGESSSCRIEGLVLEINIKIILIYFRIRKTSWRNPGKSWWEASSFLSETLKSENKESGKTLSALKEVLGSAHEITKTLVEGKTHGHLQVPTAPTKPPTTEKKSTHPPTRRSLEPEPQLTTEIGL